MVVTLLQVIHPITRPIFRQDGMIGRHWLEVAVANTTTKLMTMEELSIMGLIRQRLLMSTRQTFWLNDLLTSFTNQKLLVMLRRFFCSLLLLRPIVRKIQRQQNLSNLLHVIKV